MIRRTWRVQRDWNVAIMAGMAVGETWHACTGNIRQDTRMARLFRVMDARMARSTFRREFEFNHARLSVTRIIG